MLYLSQSLSFLQVTLYQHQYHFLKVDKICQSLSSPQVTLYQHQYHLLKVDIGVGAADEGAVHGVLVPEVVRAPVPVGEDEQDHDEDTVGEDLSDHRPHPDLLQPARPDLLQLLLCRRSVRRLLRFGCRRGRCQ